MTKQDHDNINTSVKHYLKDLSTSSLNTAMTFIHIYVEYAVSKYKTTIERDDLIQIAWLKVLEVLKTYVPDDRPFTALMKVVVKNAIKNEIIKEKAYKKRIKKVSPTKKDAVNLFDINMKDAPIKHISVEDYLKEQKKLNRKKK